MANIQIFQKVRSRLVLIKINNVNFTSIKLLDLSLFRFLDYYFKCYIYIFVFLADLEESHVLEIFLAALPELNSKFVHWKKILLLTIQYTSWFSIKANFQMSKTFLNIFSYHNHIHEVLHQFFIVFKLNDWSNYLI